MINELRNMASKTFKITVLDNSVDINNYTDVLVFDEDKIIIKANNKTLKIKGTNLLITRLENSELQIKGNIKTIDLGD